MILRWFKCGMVVRLCCQHKDHCALWMSDMSTAHLWVCVSVYDESKPVGFCCETSTVMEIHSYLPTFVTTLLFFVVAHTSNLYFVLKF